MTTTFIGHCETVYRALDERATIKIIGEPPEEAKVFVGKVVEVFRSLGISQTYYGPVFKTLEEVGAILRIQQGGRNVDTVIQIKQLPTVWPENLGWKGRTVEDQPLTDDSTFAMLLSDVQALKDSTGGLNVVLALAELEQRIEALETHVQENAV